MRRALLLFAIASFAAACAAPAPSATLQPASTDPVAVTPVSTSSPPPIPTPAGTATLAPTATPAEITPEAIVAPPLDVDFSTAPTFPSPVLVVGKARTRAIGESGCPQIVYEPADDELGRQSQMQGACIAGPVLTFANAVRVAPGSLLVFTGPKGWDLGAGVAVSTDPYGPFWIVEATRLAGRPSGATPLAGVSGDGRVEIGRGEGFRLDEITAQAPSDPGDYLVSVQSQVGQTPPTWRTYDRTYYYWIRVP